MDHHRRETEARVPALSARGRVLIVGEAADATALGESTVGVGNIFEAIGEIGAATTSDPIELVLLPARGLPVIPRRAADAIRRIDPAVRIALVTDDAAADAAGFDTVLQLPRDEPLLHQMLNGAQDADDAPAPEPISRPAPPPEPAPEIQPAPPPEPASPPAPPPAPRFAPPPPPDLKQPSPREPIETDAQAEPTPAAGSPPPHLGDIDLVDALMKPAGPVRDLATRLIIQQTGWSDLRFMEALDPADDDPFPTRCAVRGGSRAFGWLRTGHAGAGELQPWADWLGRWLLLQHRHERLRTMAYRDDLTGAWNRRFFHRFLVDVLGKARDLRRQVTVMVFDLDNFKQYNDRFGHPAGDEILVETVRLLNSVIRQDDRVCRIGGDEFAVIFADLEAPRAAGSSHPSGPELIAARFQEQIRTMRFPKLGLEAPGTLSVSAGLASYPWDGTTPEQLLECADQRALCSKRSGKNSITLGPESESDEATERRSD